MKYNVCKDKYSLHKRLFEKVRLASLLVFVLSMIFCLNVYADDLNACKPLREVVPVALVKSYLNGRKKDGKMSLKVIEQCNKNHYTVIFRGRSNCYSSLECFLGALYIYKDKNTVNLSSIDDGYVVKIDKNLNGLVFNKAFLYGKKKFYLRALKWRGGSNAIMLTLRGIKDQQLVNLAKSIEIKLKQNIKKRIDKNKIWPFVLDQNKDGKVTISDLARAGEKLFALPGNTLIYFDIVPSKKITDFLELSRPEYFGSFSIIISVIFWIVVFLIAVVVTNISESGDYDSK